jgi:peptidoglycan/LPS O-acetylase OafA/YrhL
LKDRLGVLDGLRGIAVLLVLWYHIWELSWLPAPWPWMQFIPETGFIGVHLFFFLSGFVITYPFLRAQAAGQPQPLWRHFAYRRFIKIVPSYVLSIAVAYLIGYAAVVRYGDTPAWKEILTHLLFIHTWWQGTYGSINGVLWTLAVEVEFYLIFPLVWFCFRRAPWVTAAVMAALAVLWRMWTAHCCFDTTFPVLAENLPGYLDIFASGMICALLFVRFGHRLRESAFSPAMIVVAIAGWIAFITLLMGIFAYRMHPQWEVAGQLYTRVLYGAAFAAIAFGSLCAPRWWQVLLANPPLRFLAIISYNLYLYHQMIAREMVTWHFPPYTGDPHADHTWQVSYTLLAFVVTIVQAALVTYLIERPLLRLPEPGPVRHPAGHLT